MNNIVCIAQNSILTEGITLSQAGEYDQAENLLSSVAALNNSHETDIAIARGYNYSWWKKFDQAIMLFNDVTTSQPDNVEAHLGLAYTYMWNKDYDNASDIFKKVLKKDNRNKSALFGLAYNYLESNDLKQFKIVLQRVKNHFQYHYETYYLEGLGAVKENNYRLAKKAYNRSLKLNPEYQAAKDGLENLKESNKRFEVDTWYGFSSSDSEDRNGLRRFDLKFIPNAENVFFAYYDDALILDNAILSSVERTAPIIGIGAKHDWSKKWFSKLEVGRRFLSTQDDQHLMSIENGYFFTDKLLGKVFTQYDLRQNDEVFTAAIFGDYELAKGLRLELGFFHSENLTFRSTHNERLLLSTKLQLGKTELLAGTYYDMFKTLDVSLNQLGGGFGLFAFPVIKNLRGKLFFNYDKGFNNEVTIVSLGVNQKF